MPDLATSVTALGKPSLRALRLALAEAVLAVPGVVRLEPTLSTSGPGLLLHPDPTDGVRLLVRADRVEVDISIATTAARQARAVTHDVQGAVTALLLRHGHTHSSVAISVLRIVADQAAGRS